MHKLLGEVINLTKSNDELSRNNKKIKDEVIDLKCRSMRDNMLFFGVPESQSPVYAGVGSAPADDQATSMDASSSAPVGQPIPSTMFKPPDTS